MPQDTDELKEEEKQQCPKCGRMMYAVRGSKQAVCRKCGYKEDCC